MATHSAIAHFEQLAEQGVLFSDNDMYEYLRGYEFNLKSALSTPPVFTGLDLFRVQTQQLSELLHVTTMTISRWKSGASPIPIVQLENLCQVLGYFVKSTRANLAKMNIEDIQVLLLTRHIEEADYCLEVQQKIILGLKDERRKKQLLKKGRKNESKTTIG